MMTITPSAKMVSAVSLQNARWVATQRSPCAKTDACVCPPDPANGDGQERFRFSLPSAPRAYNQDDGRPSFFNAFSMISS
jgi:hypothetical protein